MGYTELTLTARGNVLPSRFVKLDGSTECGVLQAGDNAEIIGIAQAGTNLPQVTGMITATYAAVAGQQVMVAGLGSVCLLEVGAQVQPGQLLKSNLFGQGVPITPTATTIQNYGAIALQGGHAGEKVRVQVLIGKVRPALEDSSSSESSSSSSG